VTVFPRPTPLSAALLCLPLLSVGCSRDDLYGEATFTDNVAEAYADCDPGEIKFLSGKHNLRLAFRACGSNKFHQTAWSPDGTILYFQLTHGGHLLIGDEKRIETIDLETPVGPAAWLRDHVLAIPLPPLGAVERGESEEVAARRASQSGKDYRVAIYDWGARTVEVFSLPGLREPADLAGAGKANQLVLTGIGDDGLRRPYRFDPDTGTVERVLTAVDADMKRFVWEPRADLASWSSAEGSELVRISTGEVVKELPGVQRAIPHPDGRYVALELEGAPISHFDQRTWRELSPEAREREEARKAQWLATLPDWAPREAMPPELHVLDLQKDERWRITAWYGDHFAWLAPQPYWCSMIIWGIENKQLHRNVAFTDLREKLRMADKGQVPYGMEAWPADKPVSAATPAADTVSPKTPLQEGEAPKSP
jgi:hypothetical protein